jgi:hypothetical protein
MSSSVPESTGISDVLTNEAKPKTSATITLRIIKSFEYRTERSLVLHDLNLESMTVGELKAVARQGDHMKCHSQAAVLTEGFESRFSCGEPIRMETIPQR